MLNSITTETRKIISLAVKKANYPDQSRIIHEIEEHIIESQFSTKQIATLLKKLANNHPWEYIRGWAEFSGSKFIVSQNTLIPRLETEILVDLAIKKILKITRNKHTSLQIIDIGTGSGVIIISIAKKLSELTDLIKIQKNTYLATDISDKALEIAKQNQQNIIPKEEIQFISANLLQTNKIDFASPTLILANLPYIGEKEYRNLDDSVKKHEPRSALVGGNIGHELYIELLKQTNKFLQKPSQIWEASPTTIPPLSQYLDQKEIPHQTIRDQFQINRFLTL